MGKNGKKFLIIIVIALLILAITWIFYENYKTEPANVNTTISKPDENKGIDNIINDFIEVEATNTTENGDEPSQEDETITDNSQSEANPNNSENKSEVVSGTATSREEQAIEIAKEYYEKEYGSYEGLSFSASVYKDGRYIVTVGSAELGIDNKFFLVDLSTELVEER